MNKDQKVLFLAGFPRAGSTLLTNILAQNPNFYATPTSGLVSSIIGIRDNWIGNDVYKSSGEEFVYPKIKSMLKYMILGYYAKEIKEKKIPLEKNRAWTSHIDLLDDIFGFKVKMIFPIRHVIDVVDSMERSYRKSRVNNLMFNAEQPINEQTTLGRLENLIADNGVVGAPILWLKELWYRDEIQDRIVFVPYDDLIHHTQKTLSNMYDQLEMPRFYHDIKNVKQTVVEYDTLHHYAPNALHKIKEGEIKPPTKPKTYVYDKNTLHKLHNERFGDISKYINDMSIIKKEVNL